LFYDKVCNVDKIVVVAAYEIQKSCFGVSGVVVGSLHPNSITESDLHMQPLPQFYQQYRFLSYNDLLLYITLLFYNFSNTIHKLPEDGAEAPEHVGAFVI